MPRIVLNTAQIVERGRAIHDRTPVTFWSSDGPEVTTFSVIAACASALVHALRDELDIDGDQRITILMYNCVEHFEAFLDAASMDAIFQPLNKQPMSNQIVHIIDHTDDQAIIADPTEVELLAEVLLHCPRVRTVIITGIDSLSDATGQLPGDVP